jgi:hypothetical protein
MLCASFMPEKSSFSLVNLIKTVHYETDYITLLITDVEICDSSLSSTF